MSDQAPAPSSPSPSSGAPSAAPTQAPSGGDDTGTAGVDWSALTGLGDDSPPEQAPDSEAGQAGAAPTDTGAAAPVGGQPVEAAQPPAVLPTAPVTVPQVQQPGQPAEGQPGDSLPDVDVHSEAFQAEQIRQLSGAYALTEEQAERLQTEPAVVLPELAARLHNNVRYEVAHFLDLYQKQVLPKILEQAISGAFKGREESASHAKQVETEVFSKYEKLRGVPMETLTGMAALIRSQMPNAAPADRVKALARGIYAVNGWAFPGDRPAQVAPAAEPQPAPWMPIAPGAAPPPAPRASGPASNNPWSELLDH